MQWASASLPAVRRRGSLGGSKAEGRTASSHPSPGVVVRLLCAAAAILYTHRPGRAPSPRHGPACFRPPIEEKNQATPEIATEELLAILATNSEPVFDVRFAKEYAIAHIPGTINIFEKEVERIVELHPNREDSHDPVLQWPVMREEQTDLRSGWWRWATASVRRYQLGMPVWRALSQTVQTNMLGMYSTSMRATGRRSGWTRGRRQNSRRDRYPGP